MEPFEDDARMDSRLVMVTCASFTVRQTDILIRLINRMNQSKGDS